MNTIHIVAADPKTAEEVFSYLNNLVTISTVNVDTEANVYATTGMNGEAVTNLLHTRFGNTIETITI